MKNLLFLEKRGWRKKMKMEKNVKNGKRHGTKGIEEGDKHV